MNILDIAKATIVAAVFGMCWQPAVSQEVMGSQGKSSGNTGISISYQLRGEWEISGLQFDVNYNPETYIPSLERCLAGLPESHKGAFATCKALPEKSMVRVVVMDLGRNRLLPSNSVLGTIEFSRTKTRKSVLSASSNGRSLPNVSNVVLGNADGKASDAPVDKAFRASVTK